jgi:hypothetical protein
MRATALLLLTITASGCAGSISRIESPAFDERLDAYMAVRHAAEEEVGRVQAAATARRITADADELARAIRERRLDASAGDIFTPEVAAAFQAALRRLIESAIGPAILARVANPNPGPIALHVNDTYPSTAPRTSMPYQLLRVLPRLPKELKYRFAGRDLLVLDVNTELVAAILRDALPALPTTTSQ